MGLDRTCGLNLLYMCSLSRSSRLSQTPSASVRSCKASGRRASSIILRYSQARGLAWRTFSSLERRLVQQWDREIIIVICGGWERLREGGDKTNEDLYFMDVIGFHDVAAIDLVKDITALQERDLLLNSHLAPFGIGICNFVGFFTLAEEATMKVYD